MQTVPLQAIPNQTVQAQLNNQACTIGLTQTAYGMFMSLFVGATPIIFGVLCQNMRCMIRSPYLGFVGDLVFQDTAGTSDPIFTGLGGPQARYQLAYLLPSEVPTGVF